MFPNNADPINYLIREFHFERYLEIGVCGYQDKKDAGETWHRIRIAHKDGVDPAGNPANYHMTSDDFFTSINDDVMWDIIFIDGSHHYAQVKRDAANSLKHLAPGGIILMHDVYPHPALLKGKPPYEDIFSHIWCAIADLSITRDNLDFYVYEMIRADGTGSIQGMGIIKKTDEKRKCAIVSEYTPGKKLNWSVVDKIKYKIFDRVLDKESFEEEFHVIAEKQKQGTS